MDLARLRRSLLRWFSRAKRPLPWRATRDPYALWVSEMMLQQTAVAAVIPFYERFMKRFPTLTILASATEDQVLSRWSGLGYYSRAKNLRLGAKRVVESHHGRFPRDVQTAMTLPGVGRYTASAVTSMAYGARAAVVDGNVRRVLSRLFAARGLADARAWELAERLLSPRSPGAWNEAMMELGATVCTPRNPRCESCPVSADCRGQDRAEHWSAGRPRPGSVKTRVEMALVEKGGRILLRRNPEGETMAGLYELPHTGLPGRAEAAISLKDRYLGILRIDSTLVATISHAITHHRIAATIFRAELVGRSPKGGASFHPIDEALGLPLGGLTRKALRAAGVTRGPKAQGG